MALTFLLLYLLATCDTAFCGYRAEAGWNARLFKWGYYLRAMGRGVLWGQLAVALAGSAAGLLVVSSPSPGQLLDDYAEAGGRLLQVYLPFAGVIGLAFALRTLPSVDLRSLTSVLVFGPLTLLRPPVALAGVAWALLHVPRAEVAVMTAVALPMILLLERFLYWRRAFGQTAPGTLGEPK
jgi:hypothetical protein